jgi:hypothetical protein
MGVTSTGVTVALGVTIGVAVAIAYVHDVRKREVQAAVLSARLEEAERQRDDLRKSFERLRNACAQLRTCPEAAASAPFIFDDARWTNDRQAAPLPTSDPGEPRSNQGWRRERR